MSASREKLVDWTWPLGTRPVVKQRFTQPVRRRRARELAAVALELLALGGDDVGGAFCTKRSLASIFSARAISCARRRALGLGVAVGSLRRALGLARRRRRSAPRRPRAAATTPRAAEHLRRLLHAARARPPRSSSPASGHGATISRVRVAGRFDQISSVTCGMHRVQQRQQPLERRGRRRARVGVAVVEARLDRLEVPVAEVVEGEVVELVRRRARSRTRRGSSSTARCVCDSRARIQRSSSDDGRSAGSRALAALQDQPRRVPELVRELRALLDRRVREAHVLRERVLQQPVARRRRCRSARSISSGSMPVPSDFDMRRPSGASTVEWMITSRNGISPSSSSPQKIIRFSQRRMISRAVVCRSPG